MGLNSAEDVVYSVSRMLSEALNSRFRGAVPQKPIDVGEYFRENTVDGSSLKDDDLVTVSSKTDGGYKAVFVRLGDLRKFIVGG